MTYMVMVVTPNALCFLPTEVWASLSSPKVSRYPVAYGASTIEALMKNPRLAESMDGSYLPYKQGQAVEVPSHLRKWVKATVVLTEE